MMFTVQAYYVYSTSITCDDCQLTIIISLLYRPQVSKTIIKMLYNQLHNVLLLLLFKGGRKIWPSQEGHSPLSSILLLLADPIAIIIK
jgi:hypothetical protein